MLLGAVLNLLASHTSASFIALPLPSEVTFSIIFNMEQILISTFIFYFYDANCILTGRSTIQRVARGRYLDRK